jgi:small-conductance mechanosensitive channel
MPVLTALGLGSLAIALALQDTLSNLFSGLQILASKQIKPGDFVGLDSGEQGEIIDITWRNTIIREISNNEIIVPNSRMASVTLTNYQLPEQELSIPVEIGVAYGSDLELVERVAAEVALEVVRECEEGVTDFEPLVRFYSFGDSAVEFRVILRAIRYRDRFPLVHEFVKRVHARFAEEGIEIPFPQRVVHMEGSAEDD